jgi:chorismate mutase
MGCPSRHSVTDHDQGAPAEVNGVELEALRAEIGRVDEAIVFLIDERLRLARRIGALKRGAGLGVLDPTREAAVVRRAGTVARERGLDDEAVRDVFWRLIEMARGAQQD